MNLRTRVPSWQGDAVISEVSVVLPVLNERDNLRFLIPDLTSMLRLIADRFEVIVIDDSSDDGTSELMRDLSCSEPALRYISRKGRARSLPDSIRVGIEAAGFEMVAWMDADGSMRATDLRVLLSATADVDMTDTVVVGSRFVPGGGFKGVVEVGNTPLRQVVKNIRESNDSLLAVALSAVLHYYLWISMRRCCRDLASGFIVMNRARAREVGIAGNYGDYCPRLIFLAHLTGLKVLEVPYVIKLRMHGTSKTGANVKQLIQRGLPYVLTPWTTRREFKNLSRGER